MSKVKLSETDSFEIDPIQLFTPNRLDLVFKLIFGEAIKRNSKAKYPIRLYTRHLFTVTGRNRKFLEYGNFPPKIGLNAFVEVFRSLLAGDAGEFPPIQVDRTLQLNNGAHRTVAALLQQSLVAATLEDRSRGIKANYHYFKESNRFRYRLSQADLDYILLRFAKISPTTKILIVYPSMRRKRLLEELRSNESFFAERSFQLNPVAKQKLLKFLYPAAENFVNASQMSHDIAFRDRFNHPGRIKIFFFDSADPVFLKSMKARLREKYKLGNGQIHTPDTSEEANDLLEVLLIKNTRKNLHNFDLSYAKDVSLLWSKLMPLAGDAAVVGSGPLALLGLRTARDLDLITYTSNLPKKSSSFDFHNEYWQGMRFNIDEILDNPKNYIMVFGVKYVSIRNVSKFKLYRHERKDVVDLWLISKSHLKFAHNASNAFFHFYKGYLREIRNLSRRLAK